MSRRPVARVFLLGGLLAAFAGFIALGLWQVERRAWKLDLIQRVEARVHAPPSALPPAAQWPTANAARDEYRHVRASGRFLANADTRVQAVTELGPGFWLLTPLRLDDGHVVMVNRGFVSPRWAPQAATDTDTTDTAARTVTGLLRLDEPGGGFLRRNDPRAGRWYSRDVRAIARARGLPPVAPYFIDAGRDPADTVGNGDHAPVGGLTVLRFRNQHLQYALTWFALAVMVAVAFWRVCLHERRHGQVSGRSTGEGRTGSSQR